MNGNPWLTTSLDDYEAHMSLESVGQAQLLAALLGEFAGRERPGSLALLGCAGGNGLERLDPATTRRVVAVDVNRTFVAKTEERHAGRFEAFEGIVARIPDASVTFEPVRMIFAGLLLEYVPVAETAAWMRDRLAPGGLVVVALQLPSATLPTVSPSPYRSLEVLGSVFEYREPAEVARVMGALGGHEADSFRRAASGGKEFAVQGFRF